MIIWIGIATVILVGSIPRECWRASRGNCRRHDGTLSRRRMQRELSATYDYAGTLLVPLLLMTLLLFVVLQGIFTYLMPADLMVDAVDALATGSRSELESVRREHEQEFLRRGMSASQIRDLQRFLWRNWLILGVVSLCSFVAASWFVLQAATRESVRFVKGVRLRKQCYATEDESRRLLAVATETPVSNRKSLPSG
ncbi:MAG: hypothetical protein R3C19_02865 [Planctomycetaceae bacterium]